MQRSHNTTLVAAALCVAFVIAATPTADAQSVTFIGSTTSSDYSDSGLNLGNEGFWFANFNAPAPSSGAAIDTNAVSSLPSWVLPVNPVPSTTFSPTSSTRGGQGWPSLTLPDGTVGQSGAVVDSNTNNVSNNTIQMLSLGAGTPSSFFFHVVTDNTNGQHDPVNRLRARAEQTGVFDVSAVNTPPGLAANMNGTPDVYTWLYEGMAPGAFIKLQLNSGDSLEAASIAGFMFDMVPEPSSAALLAFAVACGTARFRRRVPGAVA